MGQNFTQMRKHILSFLSISLFTITNLFAQHASIPKNIQSPNAASLGQYGDVPVSFYHGTANVNIPIYSTKEQGITLDIYLNYYTS